ncbi:YggT family protein [Cryobacterium sp. TMT1-21]|uniref:YggT family protein n=1 Tax=Cryobacterium shii TaxID=1259235 RepID=A0AAQ2C8K9_9MICO|nr:MULTISPECIES: YggT family protein [Cryobacterium]TFC52043.1 YggT family protein [Cryobacterium shii]TFC85464.1 YggT family protein [Cryobacterium sp. TmT2-59]TFD06945.1 YggT family protein [Cryobacterium sp. TMT1-21]TFD16838.1 YggT family protein [Cryobacterium sp. TMT2-23]TFD19938.1 YggT family protein [Cryobacterium sp. TMT4-10]
MSIIGIIAGLAYFVLLLYFFVMWGRFIVDLVRSVNRSWRPQGFTLVLIEFVYTVTDPPIKFFRRLLPPLRLGPIAFDFGWSLTMLCVIIGMSVMTFAQRL